MATSKFIVGARVEGGETPSDYDTGRAVALDRGEAVVDWTVATGRVPAHFLRSVGEGAP
jgi:hypothetical protein